MSHSLGIAIESLVAILLMLTIGYCMLLNKRLKRLKADELSLQLKKQLAEGDAVFRRLSRIAIAARPGSEPEAAAPKISAAKAVAAAAQAFSERRRSDGLAA